MHGLFDLEFRLGKIDRNGDPLAKLNQFVPWEEFRAELATLRVKERKSPAGAKGYDLVLLFKVLVLQSLYNLADDALEMQILDRLSFMRFLGLTLGDKVPDAKTIWLFREELGQAGLARKLFERFDAYLREQGFAARKGQIVDACIVQVPKQRNTREENEKIKAGKADEIEDWSENKRRQKDVTARWKQKNGKNFFGYENHVQGDVKHKFIRDYAVTDASVHDSRVFTELLDERNTNRGVWADSAYRAQEKLAELAALGYRGHLQRKGTRGRELSEKEKQGNRTRSRIRSRIEHIFGVQAQRMKNTLLRGIGSVRATCKIGLRNLAYNLDRFAWLRAAAGKS
jgi:transposase, IS5 family